MKIKLIRTAHNYESRRRYTLYRQADDQYFILVIDNHKLNRREKGGVREHRDVPDLPTAVKIAEDEIAGL